MRSFKSNENIHKKEGGSYYVVLSLMPQIVMVTVFRRRKKGHFYPNLNESDFDENLI